MSARGFESNAQLAEGNKPAVCALDDPAMFAESVMTLNAAARDARFHAALPRAAWARSRLRNSRRIHPQSAQGRRFELQLGAVGGSCAFACSLGREVLKERTVSALNSPIKTNVSLTASSENPK